MISSAEVYLSLRTDFDRTDLLAHLFWARFLGTLTNIESALVTTNAFLLRNTTMSRGVFFSGLREHYWTQVFHSVTDDRARRSYALEYSMAEMNVGSGRHRPQ